MRFIASKKHLSICMENSEPIDRAQAASVSGLTPFIACFSCPGGRWQSSRIEVRGLGDRKSKRQGVTATA